MNKKERDIVSRLNVLLLRSLVALEEAAQRSDASRCPDEKLREDYDTISACFMEPEESSLSDTVQDLIFSEVAATNAQKRVDDV